MSEPHLQLIPEEELAAILAAAILDGKGGRMTRDAQGYLAAVCAESLVDRLALPGVVVVRNASWTGGGDGGAGAAAFNSTGREVLQRMIEFDDGARRLGKVALVPASSPISTSGLLFLNTLFDESAASHIALGQAYKKCFVDGNMLSQEEFTRRGGNSSLIHVDWMIGSAEVDVDGIDAHGAVHPVVRAGAWAF